MGFMYLWGCSIQEMGGDVVIGRSIYGVVVINGSLYSRFYGIYPCRHVTLYTLTGSLVETSPVWSKEGPVVKHLTLLEDSHAGRVVLQGHLHHSGILHDCIRGHQKQLQLDVGGKFWKQ